VLTKEREETLKESYRRHGVKIVFTARHVMGLRAAAFLTAGIARVPFPRFLAADLAASMLGVPISFGLAFFFTDQLERILTDVRRVERWVILLGFVVLAAFIAVRAWRRGRRGGARGGRRAGGRRATMRNRRAIVGGRPW